MTTGKLRFICVILLLLIFSSSLSAFSSSKSDNDDLIEYDQAPWSVLPPEVFQQIFGYFPIGSLLNLRMINQSSKIDIDNYLSDFIDIEDEGLKNFIEKGYFAENYSDFIKIFERKIKIIERNFSQMFNRGKAIYTYSDQEVKHDLIRHVAIFTQLAILYQSIVRADSFFNSYFNEKVKAVAYELFTEDEINDIETHLRSNWAQSYYPTIGNNLKIYNEIEEQFPLMNVVPRGYENYVKFIESVTREIEENIEIYKESFKGLGTFLSVQESEELKLEAYKKAQRQSKKWYMDKHAELIRTSHNTNVALGRFNKISAAMFLFPLVLSIPITLIVLPTRGIYHAIKTVKHKNERKEKTHELYEIITERDIIAYKATKWLKDFRKYLINVKFSSILNNLHILLEGTLDQQFDFFDALNEKVSSSREIYRLLRTVANDNITETEISDEDSGDFSLAILMNKVAINSVKLWNEQVRRTKEHKKPIMSKQRKKQ